MTIILLSSGGLGAFRGGFQVTSGHDIALWIPYLASVTPECRRLKRSAKWPISLKMLHFLHGTINVLYAHMAFALWVSIIAGRQLCVARNCKPDVRSQRGIR
jgi:hypothetical protein